MLCWILPLAVIFTVKSGWKTAGRSFSPVNTVCEGVVTRKHRIAVKLCSDEFICSNNTCWLGTFKDCREGTECAVIWVQPMECAGEVLSPLRWLAELIADRLSTLQSEVWYIQASFNLGSLGIDSCEAMAVQASCPITSMSGSLGTYSGSLSHDALASLLLVPKLVRLRVTEVCLHVLQSHLWLQCRSTHPSSLQV